MNLSPNKKEQAGDIKDKTSSKTQLSSRLFFDAADQFSIYLAYILLQTTSVIDIHRRLTVDCRVISPQILKLAPYFLTTEVVGLHIGLPTYSLDLDRNCATRRSRSYLRKHDPKNTQVKPSTQNARGHLRTSGLVSSGNTAM